MSIEDAFNAVTPTYDDWMRRALPGYADLFETAVNIIPFSNQQKIRVLDLGAGTGLFSKVILEAFPRAEIMLMDVAEKMLDVARERFTENADQIQINVSDYRELDANESFDLIISSLSIHHLEDKEKHVLIGAVFNALKNHGVFVNVDQIRGETEIIKKLYWNRWLQHVKQSGATHEQIESSIARRAEFDRDALLSDQIAWLKSAGFNHVDCVYKNYFLGVFLGIKDDPGRTPDSFSQYDSINFPEVKP